MTVPVAFYGFQEASNPRVVTEDGRWQGWFKDRAAPLIAKGFPDQHLHNPFGLHQAVAGRDSRVMHVDQFDLSYCKELLWLADRDGFAEVVGQIHARGGTVQAYVGSPLVVGRSPQSTFFPRCSPGSERVSRQVRLFQRTGLCRSPVMGGCLCWDRLVRFHIDPLIAAKVDAIGFDASADFHPGDCMDRLVRSLLARRFEVMIEAWPRSNRDYPPVSWIIREVLYQRISLDAQSDEAPLASVRGTINRIVPAAHTRAGQKEFTDINTIRVRKDQEPFETFEEIIEAVKSAGHVPLVRAAELAQHAAL